MSFSYARFVEFINGLLDSRAICIRMVPCWCLLISGFRFLLTIQLQVSVVRDDYCVVLTGFYHGWIEINMI